MRQMSSLPVTFYPRPLIWTTTCLSKHHFLRNRYYSLDCLVHLTKMAEPPYMVKQNLFHYKL